MKKFILSLLICFISMSSFTYAQSNQEVIKAIDVELKSLRSELKKSDLQTGNEDTDSQNYMLEDYSRYEQETQDIEKSEVRSQKIKVRIKALEDKKAEILKATP